MEYKNIITRIDGPLGIIAINRPESRNALNVVVLQELRDALEDYASRDDVGAVVITGEGDKTFVAGADINQLAGYTFVDALTSKMQRLYDYIEGYEKPTIAAINGIALGGGLELAMSCDIRIASNAAKFGLPETNLGIIPGAGGTQRLSRLIGRGRALEMILTGRLIRADEALASGLITKSVEPQSLMEAVLETAQQILVKGPLAIRLAKLVVKEGAEASQQTGLLLERLAQSLLYSSEDKKEGTAAFIEKRSANFTGK